MRALILVCMILWGGAAAAQTLSAPVAASAAPVPHSAPKSTSRKTVSKTAVAKAGAKPTAKLGTKTKTVTKTTTTKTTSKIASKTAAPKKLPVVTPRHGGVARRPVHPTVAVTAAPKGVAKPVAPQPTTMRKPELPAPALPANVGTVTHLPLPRYVSLKSDEVNMRSGPGFRYPVLWTYKRRDLPMKVEREFDVWRLVEDMDGIKGWVQQNTLTGKRNFVVIGTEPLSLRAEADASSDAVAILKPGVVGHVRSCNAGAAWCQVQVAGYRGWLERNAFWGTDPGEAVQP